MGRPAKSLASHVRDCTFRARRNAHLLAGPVVPWPQLAEIQCRYVGTEHPLEQRAIAWEFELAVSDLAEDEDEAAARAAVEAELHELLDAEPAEVDVAAIGHALDRGHRATWARD